MNVFSMCSGICTAEVGMRAAMSNAVFVGRSEIDRFAESIAKYHFPDVKNYGDATKLIPDELPDFSFFVAGFPCQSFSIAGKRQGFNEARGTLFFEIARILSHKRPSHFLLENVKGLDSHDGGKTVGEIFRILSELGYFVEKFVLNSKDFGVPQNRERVFFVGHSASECQREILSIGDCDGDFDGSLRQRNDIAHTITNDDKARGSYVVATSAVEILSKDGTPKNKDVASCLSGGGHSGGNHSDMDLITVGTLRTHKDGEGFREMQDGLAPTLAARARNDGSGQAVIAVPVLTPDRPTKRQNGRRFKENGDDAFTLTSQDRHGVMGGSPVALNEARHGERIYDSEGIAVTLTANPAGGTKNEPYLVDRRIRRLTPTECERLQGLEDDYTKYGIDAKGNVYEVSDSQRYKTLGNAMTVNVITAIVSRMMEVGCIPNPNT